LRAEQARDHLENWIFFPSLIRSSPFLAERADQFSDEEWPLRVVVFFPAIFVVRYFDRLSIGLYMNLFERTMEEKNYLTQMGIFSGRLVTDAHSNRHLFTHTGGLPSCTSS
jgi:hypothetical protein